MKTFIDYEKDDSINHLSDAISSLSRAAYTYISIPDDFRLYNSLSNKLSIIKDDYNELKSIKTWLWTTKSRYQGSVVELGYTLRRVGDVEITPYESKISE